MIYYEPCTPPGISYLIPKATRKFSIILPISQQSNLKIKEMNIRTWGQPSRNDRDRT